MTSVRLLGFTAALAVLGLSASASAQGIGVQPGMWAMTVTIKSVQMSGAPPAVAQAMTGRTTSTTHCITPADAAKGPQELLKAGGSCKFTKYQVAGGQLDSAMTCDGLGGGSLVATSHGAYTPTSFHTEGTSTMSGRMSMTMTSVVEGRRTGECTK